MIATLDECPPARLDCAPAIDDADAGEWHLVQAKRQREKRLAVDLYRLGLDFFFPISERVKKTAWRQRIVSYAPLFPPYLFLRGGQEEIGAALGTQFIHRVARIPNQNRLRRELANIERAIALNPRIEQCEFAVQGRRVRVTEGAFEGLEGIVLKRGKDTLIVISVEQVGQAAMEIDAGLLTVATMEIDQSKLEPAD